MDHPEENDQEHHSLIVTSVKNSIYDEKVSFDNRRYTNDGDILVDETPKNHWAYQSWLDGLILFDIYSFFLFIIMMTKWQNDDNI